MNKFVIKIIALISAFAISSFCLTACSARSAEHVHDWNDGACLICGEVCTHDWDTDVRCTVCGIKLSNTVQNLHSASENGNIYGKLFLPSAYNGKLKTVIICHGFGVNSTNAVPTYLARRGYACYAFDFCGGSRSTRSDMDMDDMTILTEKTDLLAVFDTVKALPFVDEDGIYLYGESQGGLVCSIAAVELANDISGLILMYPGFSMVSQIAGQYPERDKIPDKINVGNETLNKTYAQAIYEFLPDSFDITDSVDDKIVLQNRLEITSALYEYIATYTGKTVIFHGDNDTLVDIAFSREAIKYYENARLYTVRGEGHGFGNAALDKTITRIDSFIKRG